MSASSPGGHGGLQGLQVEFVVEVLELDVYVGVSGLVSGDDGIIAGDEGVVGVHPHAQDDGTLFFCAATGGQQEGHNHKQDDQFMLHLFLSSGNV